MANADTRQQRDARLRALLAPVEEACWKWDADGRTLLWADGTTIAFRAEVVEVLAQSVTSGWPSFGAVVLLLAACRGSWREQANRHLTGAKDQAGVAARREPVVMLWFGRAVHALGVVAELPAERRATTAAKATLVGRICAASRPRWSPADAAELLSALRDDPPPAVFRSTAQRWWPDLRYELYALANGLAGIAPEALALGERTGVEQPPAPAELPEASAAQVRRLLLDLAGDPECGGVVRLARDLLAVAQVPRRLAEPEELPTGGYSDVGNRGRPDRLLLSELANDDLVLAVRVALNEALYLRREVPPHSPPGVRHLLLDTGIRLWGTARLVAAATALALAASGAPALRVRAWRATIAGVLPVDLASRAGLVALLAELSPLAHPGAALAPWFAAAAATAGRSGGDERIVVSHPSAVADPAFRAAWMAVGRPELLAATVDDHGAFKLLALGEPGDRVLAAATLDVRRLTESTAPPAVRVRPGATDATASERLAIFPLRVPHHCPLERCWDLGPAGVVCALTDGRCTWSDQRFSGPLELCHGLPLGRPLLIHDDGERFLIVQCGQPANRLLLSAVPRSGGLTSIVLLEQFEIHAAFMCGGALVVVGHTQVRVFALDGTPLAERDLAQRRWRHGRFCEDGIRPSLIDWDGIRLEFIDLDIGQAAKLAAVRKLTLFDRHGLDGPWLVTPRGTVGRSDGSGIPIAPPQRLAAPAGDPGWLLAGISRDGHRLLMRHSHGRGRSVIDLEQADNHRRWEPEIEHRESLADGLLKHVKAVVVHGGDLVIETAAAAFACAWDELSLALRPVEPGLSGTRIPLAAIGSKTCPRRKGEHHGVVVEIDFRGVLHLRDGQGALPEMAMMLMAGPVAVWSSDGGISGPKRFSGFEGITWAHRHLELVRRYAERLA